MDNIYQKVHSDAAPKAVYREYDIQIKPDGIHFPCGTVFAGESLIKHLNGCQKCVIMAATLGHAVDREIRGLQYVSMADAIMYDSFANTLIEKVCDDTESEIKVNAKRQGYYITTRFSPGYGDFLLANQPAMLRLSGAIRGAGITLSQDNLLLPQKSVTAIIGYCLKPVTTVDKCRNCPSAAKCGKRN